MARMAARDLTAIILAGGFGTRLRAAVADRPKVMADIGGRPFVTYLLDQVKNIGIGKSVLCTGYMADWIQGALGKDYHGMELVYSHETQPLGTGGAIRQAVAYCLTKNVLAMNGDSYCGADLSKLIDLHEQKLARATLTLVRVPDSARFGRVICDASGRVIKFEEKAPNSGPGFINTGIYLLERELVEEMHVKKNISIEREVFPKWIGRGAYGFDAGAAPFIDIGTPESYAIATKYLTGLR